MLFADKGIVSMGNRVFVKNKTSFVRVTAVVFIGSIVIAVLLPAISFSNQTRGPVIGRRLTGRSQPAGRGSKSIPQSAQNKLSPSGLQQIEMLEAEKASRTPRERKISTQLLQAMRDSRGETMAAGVNLRPVNLNLDADGKFKVDITGSVNDNLVFKIQQLGGEVISSSSEFGRMTARINLTDVDSISGFPEVKFVRPAVKAVTRKNLNNASLRTSEAGNYFPLYGPGLATNRGALRAATHEQRSQRVRGEIQAYLARSGAETNSTGSTVTEGDRTHRA